MKLYLRDNPVEVLEYKHLNGVIYVTLARYTDGILIRKKLDEVECLVLSALNQDYLYECWCGLIVNNINEIGET